MQVFTACCRRGGLHVSKAQERCGETLAASFWSLQHSGDWLAFIFFWFGGAVVGLNGLAHDATLQRCNNGAAGRAAVGSVALWVVRSQWWWCWCVRVTKITIGGAWYC